MREHRSGVDRLGRRGDDACEDAPGRRVDGHGELCPADRTVGVPAHDVEFVGVDGALPSAQESVGYSRVGRIGA